MISESKAYKEAGVDITSGYMAVQMMKSHLESTYTEGVISDIGGFGGLFMPNFKNLEDPVLVSGTDGVGTKLKLAFLMDKHDTVGIDCVAMCVNDIICSGASPLFFLDYIACGKLDPVRISQIVSGIAAGCREAGCALIGGETAEMPGFYPENEYDLAGFAVGMVSKKKILDSSKIQKGDVIIALPSSGVHSNGFSLVRKVFDLEGGDIDRYYDGLNRSLGETLLTPTKIYVKPVLSAIETGLIRSAAHITGGGLIENLPRSIGNGFCAKIFENRIKVLPIFKLIEEKGKISHRDMLNTFNMGVGFTLVVSKEGVDSVLEIMEKARLNPYILGEITEGEEKLCLA